MLTSERLKVKDQNITTSIQHCIGSSKLLKLGKKNKKHWLERKMKIVLTILIHT